MFMKRKRGRPAKPLIERFNSKINLNGPTMPNMTSNCYVWTARHDRYGYGLLRFKKGNKWIMHKAHVIAWELVNGSIPEHDSYHGLCVCHSCDNRECVRADHLFLGTIEDNIKDMLKKGRQKGRQKKKLLS